MVRSFILTAVFLTAFLMTQTGCSITGEQADLVLYGGVVYTVDEAFTVTEALAVKDGMILETGTDRRILKKYRASRTLDLKGNFVYPGWIDAHCHFFNYGMGLNAIDLSGTGSVEEIISILEQLRERMQGLWITGRGWDQNDWPVKEFPDRSMLDEHFPDTPVLLRRIDGHAAWANSAALRLAGVTAGSRVYGGKVLLSGGMPSGILVDNAIDLVASVIPPPSPGEIAAALERAEKKCFSVGLTSVQDAGLPADVVDQIDRQQREGNLKIRINAFLSPSEENFIKYVERGPYRTGRLTVNTLKLYADGALGSRGALLLEPYSDDPGNRGLHLTPAEDLENSCRRAYAHNFAVATHCIGDAANRLVLKLYGSILQGKNDRRWRIEHAQVIHPDDFHLFGQYSIIPSVQTTHATSDMYWAEDRLGPERIKGAYAYRQLMEQNGWIPNGSDFPVENINPLYGFYAAVARKDTSGTPEGGFQPENALNREQALRAMTIWAAKACFEEDQKGSLEAGKVADLVVTGQDLMSCPEHALPGIRVLATYSGGERVYEYSNQTGY
jgi:predicted amidohydrolase YtcJ